MIETIYNNRILALAAEIPRIGRLPQPDATATAHSKLCGSTVIVDVVMKDGRIADYAQDRKSTRLNSSH